MHTKKLMTLLLAVVLVLSLAACGAKGGDHMDGMDNEPKNAEEAAAMHKELTAQEAAILAENTALWEKVFMAADKGKIMMEDGKNYGDFLLETIDAAKDQFSSDELKLLQSEAEKIRDIGNKLAALEEKYPEIMQKSLDSDMNMPTDKDMDTMPDGGNKDNKTDSGSTDNKTDSGNTGNKTDSGSTGSKTDDSSLPKFPAFEGKDLDGNTVKSSDLFSGKAVTVVNFWFTTCGPCVGELGDLDALNKDLSGKGGALIGINAFTLDGNEAAISEAKDVLTPRAAPPTRTCTSIPAARRASSWRASTPIPPPTWSTAAAASWVIPLWELSPARRRPMHCKPRSTRPWLPIWADPISSKGGYYEEKEL